MQTVLKTHVSIKSYGKKKPRTKIYAIFFVFLGRFGSKMWFPEATFPIGVQSWFLCFWNEGSI